MCCKIVKINVTIVKIIQYYTILYHTILYYTILAIPEISINRLKFFQLDIKSNHLFILKSTHFQFGIDLTNFESKIGAEDQFWEKPQFQISIHQINTK